MRKKFFFLGLIPALFFQFIGAFLYFVVFKGSNISQYIYLATKILLVLWPLLWLSSTKKIFVTPFWRGDIKKSLIGGLFSGMFLLFLMGGLYFAGRDFWLGFKSQILESAKGFDILHYYILFSLFLSIIHSFLEEYYWRWFVLNGLMTKFKRNTAIIISSLAFASHHFIIILNFTNLWLALIASVGIFLVSCYWCQLYLKTQTLSGSWLSHFFADMIIMYIGYLIIFA